MGLAKRQNEQKQAKKIRQSPDERRVACYNAVAQGLESGTLSLLENIYESTAPVVQLTFRVKADGSWLAIAKRDTGDGPEVMFSGGEDIIESMVRLSDKMTKGSWREDTPYVPPSKLK